MQRALARGRAEGGRAEGARLQIELFASELAAEHTVAPQRSGKAAPRGIHQIGAGSLPLESLFAVDAAPGGSAAGGSSAVGSSALAAPLACSLRVLNLRAELVATLQIAVGGREALIALRDAPLSSSSRAGNALW